ncbi:MAG: hypothetical protein COY58_09285 [Gammaproteobacteria bacterium CG_4_10_14_0_8_um_filter_38_16]|nr:MAG: hypothetical protein COY58_09285 [Gammaproteobacteria bacterium CG_4_10_14_0_8_um_filter_38_16]PJA03566.1 MAG: hypothetical protein COX72_04485 [Gammaproteobacteria bacterium CG_4_10_14_0_2_um_filter_38_22]PJB10135.1 MAG: hypothetical protein CO120_06395 [Gammaproteobacteria bacterium CG_4_9_14_3_um_filter_38_9]
MYYHKCNESEKKLRIKISDGIEIYCELINETENPYASVLMVFPGGPGFDSLIYKNQLMFLKEKYQLLFFDPRGCGKSTALSNQNYTFDLFSRDASEILEHLNIEKVRIIGTSFGAMAGLHFAIHFPQKVETFICIGGSPSFAFLEQAKKNLSERGSDEQKEVCDRFLWRGQFQTQEDYMYFMQVMAPLYAISLKGTLQNPYQLTCNLDALNQFFANEFEHFDFIDRLSEITASVLWMVGECDWINDPCLIESVVHTIHDIHFEKVLGSGHSISKDKNDEYQKLITEFLSAHYNRTNR